MFPSLPSSLHTLLILPTFFSSIPTAANALSLPLPPLFSRQQSSGSSSGGSTPLSDKQNIQYLSNITIGGEQFRVIVDTGSSDLWISTTSLTSKQTKDLNISTGIQYALGNANGKVNAADVQFAGYTIQDQAYLLVQNASSFSSNLQGQGIDGLVGLGPGQGSLIRSNVGNSTGASLLDRIFSSPSSSSSSNYLTFALQRNNDPTPSIQTGSLTINTLLPDYTSITSTPKIPVSVLTKSDELINQHWTIQLDENGLIGPDNKTIKKSSIVPDNDGRLFAVIDSGFTLPQVPRSVSDAIYGRVQGAIWNDTHGLWTVPCAQELNVSFLIGGQRLYVHPLDTVSSDFGLGVRSAERGDYCAGTFQPITSAFSLAGQFDLILGMAFLRNTYTLLSYGSFLNGTTKSADTAPYVQFLSVTPPSSAHADFVQARLGGVDTTGSSQYSLQKKGQSSPIPLDERVVHTEQKIIRYRPIIIACSVGLGLILIAFTTWRIVKRRRARRAKEQEKKRERLKGLVLSPLSQQGESKSSPKNGYFASSEYTSGGDGGGKYHYDSSQTSLPAAHYDYSYKPPQPLYSQQGGGGYTHRGSYTDVYHAGQWGKR